MPLQIRRGPSADRLAITPLLGEIVFDTTTSTVYVGDGVTPGGIAASGFTEADARAATAKVFLGNFLNDNSVHSGVTFQLVGDRLHATLTDVIEGSLKGSLFGEDSGIIIDAENHTLYGSLLGSVFGEDSTGPLVNAQDGSINLNGTVKGHIVPDSNESYDIGTSSNRFRDLYLSGTSINLGGAVISSSDGNSVNLPAFSTVGGSSVIVNTGEPQVLDIIGSVWADDSSGPLVNGFDASINLNGTIKDDVVPDSTEVRNIGSFSAKFNKLYLTEHVDSIYLGNAIIGSSGSVINLPAGSTVGGVPIGGGSGTGDGVIYGSNYTINIVGEDSTLIVNSFTREVTATNFIGPLTGNVVSSADPGFVIIDGSLGTPEIRGKFIGYHSGDMNGSVFADDSTAIIDGVNKTVTGSFFGNITGDVTGNVTGNILGNVSGNLTGSVVTPSQPLITSLGTLSFLEISGNLNSTGNITGTSFFGNSFTGDLKGSVFADDSSLFIDSIDKKIFVSSVTVNNDLVIENGTITNNNVNSVVVFNDTAIEAKTDTATVQPGIRSTGITNGSTTTAVTALYGSRGTLASPAILNLNDNYAGTLVAAHNGTDYVLSSAVLFTADTSPSPGASSIGTKFSVLVADGSGTLFASNKQMTFDSSGTLSAPVVQVGTYTQATPSDTRPASPSPGMIIFVSDASGGSKFQGWDGGSWVSLG